MIQIKKLLNVLYWTIGLLVISEVVFILMLIWTVDGVWIKLSLTNIFVIWGLAWWAHRIDEYAKQKAADESIKNQPPEKKSKFMQKLDEVMAKQKQS